VQATVSIAAVNDAPSGTDKTITFNENSSYTFTAADFGFSDADGNSLLAVKISSLPLAGNLKLNGIVITATASISVADINNGQFTFSPAANGSGNHYASFNFQVQDNGGTANNGVDLDGSANTLSFDVTASSSTPIVGTAGNDRLKGTVGADTLLGGAGDDSYYVNVVGDTITENTGEGADVVYSTAASYTLSANIETLIIEGAGIDGTGNAQNNYLMGNAGNNSLDGQGGADVMAGGAGNDSYTVDDKGDVIIENLGAGSDTVYSSISYSLAANIENLVLTGTAINGFGNELSNQITGNNADNILGGGAGADTLIGMAGNDTYYVDNAGDVIVEAVDGGTDIVYSTTDSYTLADNIETLIVWLSAVNGTGNAQDNYIIANTRSNTLDGRAGNDVLYGDEGADTYIGGLGADSLNLTEATAATDTVRVATGDSLATVGGYDMVTGFKLGTGVFNTTGVDKLDLANTVIAANVTAADGIDSGVIRSHSINNGIISFDDINNYTSPLAISASTNLANVFSYLQTNITGGNTAAFISEGNTFVFQDGGVTDTLVELLGVTATSVNNTGLTANSVWVI
jgi:Ca2+-binding RTX toxin-like protein